MKTNNESIDWKKAMLWFINGTIAIIGFFILSTLNDIRGSIKANAISIEKNEVRIGRNEQEIIKIAGKVTEAANINKVILVRLEQKVDRVQTKIDIYDENIKRFYEKYDLTEKGNTSP